MRNLKYLKKSFLSKNLILVSIIVFLIYSIWDKIMFFIKGSVNRSNDKQVQSVIDLIDNSLSKFGTFNEDHIILDYPLSQLTKSQLIKLHKDFGYRYYNPLTRMYGITNIGNIGISESKDLNGLFDSELDVNQINRLNDIYVSKGLSFPLIN
jgi:hypothetical protein